MSFNSTYLGALQKERSITALAFIAMLLQIFFATAHLAAPVTTERSQATTNFWEICTGTGLVRIDENGNPVSPAPFDARDCPICVSAAVNGDLDLASVANFAISLSVQATQSDFATPSQLPHSVAPKTGTSRGPPSKASLPSYFS